MTDTLRCTVGGPSEPVCPRPARWRVVLGCVHEHTADAEPLCTMHLDDLIEGRVYCGPCHRAGCECLARYHAHAGREAA